MHQVISSHHLIVLPACRLLPDDDKECNWGAPTLSTFSIGDFN
jgi:hypothetical protein